MLRSYLQALQRAILSARGAEISQRSAGLAEQDLRLSLDDVVGELPYYGIAEPLIEPSRVLVERRHAHEDVGRDPQDPFFGELNQLRAQPAPPAARVDADGLDVAHKRAGHAENKEAGHALRVPGQVDLAVRIAHDGKGRLEAAP